MIGRLIVAAVLVTFGGVVGQAVASDPPPKFIKVPVTKTVTEPAPPAVEVPTVPDSCLQALEYADIIARNGDKLYARGDKELDIMSDFRRILAAGGDTDVLDKRQRDLQNNTVGALLNLSEAYSNYQRTKQECKEDMQ